MPKQANILEFISGLPKHPIFKKLQEINSHTSRVKLRARKSSSGKFSFYLEEFPENTKKKKKDNRKRTNLKLYYWGKENTKGKDKQSLEEATATLFERHNTLRKKNGNIVDEKRNETSLIEYFETLVQKKYKTDKSWKHTLNYLKEFFKYDVPFYELAEKHCEEFRDYLLNHPKLNSRNTVHTYFAKVKACLNFAVKDNYIVKNPAQFLKVKKQETFREYLELEEMKLLDRTLCKSDQTKRAFLFTCFTGLRISDIKKLRWDEIRDNYLIYRSQKTDRVEKMKLHGRALKILAEQRAYQTEIRSFSKKVFKLISDNHSGQQIKQWAKDAGINKKITWHSGRHTFATLNLTAGNDIFTTSKLLGHKDVKVTQIYAKLIDTKKDEAIDNLPDW